METRRVYDSLYGYIELDEDEFELVTSPIFQRLHWIKQAGALHTLFPGALHSRYSHSLGVFHIITKMIHHLTKKEKLTGERILGGVREEKELRFAALLHDIGHVPLSHCGEMVLGSCYEEKEEKKYKKRSLNLINDGNAPKWKNLFDEKYRSTSLHECISAEIVLHDKEINTVFENKHDREFTLRKESIAKLIVGLHEDRKLNSLLHSELDADRLDYLLRDSAFTGVGYGDIDLDYIISRLVMPVDAPENNYLCVEYKGLHAVEHYILARYFLRNQVIANRKIRYLELLYDDVMSYMVNHKRGSKCRMLGLEEFVKHIRNGETDDLHEIYKFTDALVLQTFI